MKNAFQILISIPNWFVINGGLTPGIFRRPFMKFTFVLKSRDKLTSFIHLMRRFRRISLKLIQDVFWTGTFIFWSGNLYLLTQEGSTAGSLISVAETKLFVSRSHEIYTPQEHQTSDWFSAYERFSWLLTSIYGSIFICNQIDRVFLPPNYCVFRHYLWHICCGILLF